MSDDPFWDTIPDPPRHFDRLGVPISLREWASLMEDDGYRVIEQTMIGHILVSTVWLGIDYSFGISFLFPDAPPIPIIFETMVFDTASHQPFNDLEMQRYHTEGDARDGHARMVQMVETLEGVAHDHES